MVGYVVAAWAPDLDVANGILPGYVMGLFFFTGYPLRLQVCGLLTCSQSVISRQAGSPAMFNRLQAGCGGPMHAIMAQYCFSQCPL